LTVAENQTARCQRIWQAHWRDSFEPIKSRTSQQPSRYTSVAAFCFGLRSPIFEIARVLVRLDHVARSQKVKEAHLGITRAATLLLPPLEVAQKRGIIGLKTSRSSLTTTL
jgi:hypothetical protein